MMGHRRTVCPPQVFERAAARASCLQQYSSWGSLSCCLSQRSKYRLRNRFAISVKPAPEPSDVSFPLNI